MVYSSGRYKAYVGELKERWIYYLAKVMEITAFASNSAPMRIASDEQGYQHRKYLARNAPVELQLALRAWRDVAVRGIC